MRSWRNCYFKLLGYNIKNMNYWKTITTYLVDWSPTWIKTIELSNWIWKAILIPRAKLRDVKQRQEVLQSAIYFLFWKNENGNDLAYEIILF